MGIPPRQEETENCRDKQTARPRYHRNRAAAFVRPDGAVELTRSPVSPFVASSSLTSCPSDGDRKGRGSTGLGPSFSAPREVVAREVGACTSNPATTTAPCRSIESYLSMGNNMARKAEGEEDPGPANRREKQRGGGRRGATERAPWQPRLSYADCSEQLDFNVGINPLPLNFIRGEQNAFPSSRRDWTPLFCPLSLTRPTTLYSRSRILFAQTII